MRHRHLHAALAAFAEEAAWQLASVVADGVEVPFEVVDERGHRRDTPLYCYRPLTDRFVTERVGVLTRLPAYPAAAQALAHEDGLGDYLRTQGETKVPVATGEGTDGGPTSTETAGLTQPDDPPAPPPAPSTALMRVERWPAPVRTRRCGCSSRACSAARTTSS